MSGGSRRNDASRSGCTYVGKEGSWIRLDFIERGVVNGGIKLRIEYSTVYGYGVRILL